VEVRSVARVLVVDDERDIRETTCFLLRVWGHEAHAAGDGAAAVHLVAGLRPDVVLLDVALGGRPDGYQVARRLRGLAGKQLVLVCVSGHGGDEHRRFAREAGFDYHLLKPADPEEVKRLVESVRDGRPRGQPA
jgi:CheY-like chemotaxis protein